MERLINFAVNLMERENKNLGNPDLLPSKNPLLNPMQNANLNVMKNPKINPRQNQDINGNQNPAWKREQWKLFRELILWGYLNEEQRNKCKEFLLTSH